MRNRLRENIRCGGSRDHDGRYGLSVGPPDHRPSLPSQPTQEDQPHLYLRARLCRLARPAGLADPKPRWFQYDMEVFRVGQSDAGGLHPVDLTVYLAQEKKAYVLTLVPALFMTVVCVTFLMVSNIAFVLPPAVGYAIGGGVGLATALCFMVWMRKMRAGARE